MSSSEATSRSGSSTVPEELYERGLKVRREVAGDAHVDRSLASATPFSKPIQDLATGFAWGGIWTRPGLSRRDRSILNLGMLCALNRSFELGVHLRGAINNGVTVEEIQEVLLQVSMYVGFPAAMEAFRVAEKVIDEMRASGELKEEKSSEK